MLHWVGLCIVILKLHKLVQCHIIVAKQKASSFRVLFLGIWTQHGYLKLWQPVL